VRRVHPCRLESSGRVLNCRPHRTRPPRCHASHASRRRFSRVLSARTWRARPVQCSFLDAHLHRDPKATGLAPADRYRARYFGLGRVSLLLLGDEIERAAEAGRVASGESAASASQVFLSSVTQGAISFPSRTIQHCAGVSTIEIFNIAGHGSTTRERQGACQCVLTVSRRKLTTRLSERPLSKLSKSF
jgi:hypothetical protein